MEIFFRCVRSATGYLEEMSDPRASDLAAVVRREVDLPPQFGRDREFSEILLRTGRIASNTARDSRLEKAVMGELGMQCFMCGRALTRRGNAGVDKYTVEHLWPISFGGETIEGNRSEEHTSELQSLMRISYAVFCLKKKKNKKKQNN